MPMTTCVSRVAAGQVSRGAVRDVGWPTDAHLAPHDEKRARCHDGNTHVVIGIDRRAHAVSSAHHLLVERIADVGAVERQVLDKAIAANLEVLKPPFTLLSSRFSVVFNFNVL